jgi:PAS domain S-box-containing protein
MSLPVSNLCELSQSDSVPKWNRSSGTNGKASRRKGSAEELRICEERLQLATSCETIALYEQDAELRYTWVYRSRREQSEILGKTDIEIAGPEEGGVLYRLKCDVLKTGESQRTEAKISFPEGARFYQIFVSARRNSAGEIIGVAGSALDITERKRAEERLLANQQLILARQAADLLERSKTDESVARLAAIVESSDDAIVAKDLDGIITTWNAGAERMFGYTASEVQGRPITILLPEDRQAEEPGILARIRAGERIEHFETVRRRKDGTLIDVSLSVSPVRDKSGRIIGASKIARDITEILKARAMLAKSREVLEETVNERTASLREAIAQMEEFSYSVSHDLRAPIRAMHGYAKAALEDYSDRLEPSLRNYLERIQNGSARMQLLIHDVLTYSRIARLELPVRPVRLDKLVPEIIQHYPEMQSPRAEVICREPLGSVLAHESSLTQVISNLLSNSVKFVRRGTAPKVVVRTEAQGNSVRLWIEDNGIGIDPKCRARLFGMFERVHQGSDYEGTGIGLAIVRKATEKMGGKVGVESDGKTGSRFWVELPAAPAR